MDGLHSTLASLRSETKSKDHLTVFREFLMRLEALQRQPPAEKVSRAKSPPRQRKALRRGRG